MPSFSSRVGLLAALAATVAGLAVAEPSAVSETAPTEPTAPGAAPSEHAGALALISDLARQSTLVVTGVVSRTQAVSTGPAGAPGIHTAVELAEVEALHGSVAGPVSFWVQGGVLGESARRIVGQASFRVGERVLVFLSRAPNGALWPTRMSLGKWLLEPCEDGACIQHTQAESLPLDEALRAVESATRSP